MLLELLSHQNFADMRYGLDPSFRFDVSRAVYKGVLRYLASQYATDYVVQPFICLTKRDACLSNFQSLIIFRRGVRGDP